MISGYCASSRRIKEVRIRESELIIVEGGNILSLEFWLLNSSWGFIVQEQNFKFEELPGIPRIWLDFLKSQMSELPVLYSIQSLAAQADSVRSRRIEDLIRILAGADAKSSQFLKNLQALSQPKAVVVVTEIDAGLFGGPLAQILKCLTTIRLCEELANYAVNAVPVAWVSTNSPQYSVRLIDADGEMQSLAVSPTDVIPDRIPDVILKIQEFGGGTLKPGILDLLKSVFLPGKSFSRASAELFSALLSEWGMIVIDPTAPEFLPNVIEALAPVRARARPIESEQSSQSRHVVSLLHASVVPDHLTVSSVLPVLAFVIDPFEISALVRLLPAFDETGLPRPAVWPRASLTFGDARSRRTFSRYHLDLPQLFSGGDKVLRGVMQAIPHSALEKFDRLKLEVQTRVAELGLPADSEISDTAASCRDRIVYQLEKLRAHLESALSMKEKTASRQIQKACNLLAPYGQTQERELAGIQIPLNYSHAGLRFLYEKMDILKFEHQLIWMD